MINRILATVVAIAVCGACGGATPKDTSADETKLKAELGVWFDKYNAGDVEGVVSLYAEDAISLPDKAPAASGRAAIRAYLAADIARARTAGVTFHAGAPTGLGVSGDVAWLSGTYTVNDPTGMVVDSGKYLAICHRREGDWAIVRDTWNEDTPPPPAAAPEAAAPEAAAPAAAPAAKPAPPAGSAKGGGKLSAITHVFHR